MTSWNNATGSTRGFKIQSRLIIGVCVHMLTNNFHPINLSSSFSSSSSSRNQLAVGASRKRPPNFSVHCHPNHFTQIHIALFSDIIYPSSRRSSSGSASHHHVKCNHLQQPVIIHSCHISKLFELSGYCNVHHG